MKRTGMWAAVYLFIMSFVLSVSVMLFLAAPDARAVLSGVDFGGVLVGTTKCGSTSWWNRSPGTALIVDSHGVRCDPSEVTRTVWFTTSGSDFSVTPGGPLSVQGCTGKVDLTCCVTVTSEGDHNGTLTATVSPAFIGGYTSQSASLHVKGIPSMVTAEPLGSSLSFGSVPLGQTLSRTFQVYNYNTFSVTITSITISDNNFSVSSGVNTVIPSKSYQTVTINFTPQSVGTFNGTIQVNTTAEDPTYPCSGTGRLFNITTTSSGNGTVTPSFTVAPNGNASVTMTPAAGYTLNTLKDNGTVVSATAGPSGTFTYSLTNVTQDHTLAATFRPVNTITASVSGSGGTIAPTTSTGGYGSTTITMTPSAGYTLDKLTDNGVIAIAKAGTSGTYTYTLSNITTDHTLIATFQKVYTITATVTGSGGSISPATASTAYMIGGQTFTLTPETGYTLDKLLDNGEDRTSSAEVTSNGKAFTYYCSFDKNHTIQASYKIGPILYSVPAISLPVVIFLIAGFSGVLYWRARKTKNGKSPIDD